MELFCPIQHPLYSEGQVMMLDLGLRALCRPLHTKHFQSLFMGLEFDTGGTVILEI